MSLCVPFPLIAPALPTNNYHPDFQDILLLFIWFLTPTYSSLHNISILCIFWHTCTFLKKLNSLNVSFCIHCLLNIFVSFIHVVLYSCSVFHFHCCIIVNLWIYYNSFIQSTIQKLELFLIFWFSKKPAVGIHCSRFLLHVYTSSLGMLIFNLTRKCQTVHQSGCTNWYVL